MQERGKLILLDLLGMADVFSTREPHHVVGGEPQLRQQTITTMGPQEARHSGSMRRLESFLPPFCWFLSMCRGSFQERIRNAWSYFGLVDCPRGAQASQTSTLQVIINLSGSSSTSVPARSKQMWVYANGVRSEKDFHYGVNRTRGMTEGGRVRYLQLLGQLQIQPQHFLSSYLTRAHSKHPRTGGKEGREGQNIQITILHFSTNLDLEKCKTNGGPTK